MFRTLPIAIRMPDPKVLQNKIMKFIWGDKRPRVNRRTLYTPKLRGGLEAPDLAKYFEAAQLAQLIRFHSLQAQPSWMKIELSSHPTKPISHMMWLHIRDYNYNVPHIIFFTKPMGQIDEALCIQIFSCSPGSIDW